MEPRYIRAADVAEIVEVASIVDRIAVRAATPSAQHRPEYMVPKCCADTIDGIDRRHGVMDNDDAVFLRKCLIAMREGFQRAEPSEIEVLKKQVVYRALGSTSVTSSAWEPRAKYLAAVAPRTPPPITTTRALA